VSSSFLGARAWLVPDGYIPPSSTGRFASHEAICVLNCGDVDAHLRISFYFEDRAAIKDVRATVGSERTRHIRTDIPEQLEGQRSPGAFRMQSGSRAMCP
jgi:hypothetical protein